MSYVDGFVIPLPKKNIAAYKAMSRKAGKVWMEYGALQYWECVGDDLNVQMIKATFPKLVKLKPGETGGVLVDRLQVARPPRPGEQKSDEGSAHRRHGH